MEEKIFITNNSFQTKKIGRDFGKSLKGGNIITLYGELGSGKTTFVQGLAEGLGIKKRIISPTFIIVRNYRIKNYESRIMNFYHIDLYRVSDEKSIKDLGLEEILNDPSNIVAIEWAEKIKNFLPKERTEIKFFYEKSKKRKIIFRS